MPMYDYHCPDCDLKFEKIKKLNDPSKMFSECPKCSKPSPKLFTAPAGIVNGEYEKGKMYLRK